MAAITHYLICYVWRQRIHSIQTDNNTFVFVFSRSFVNLLSASMAGLAGPLAGLSLILCCSIVVGFAFDVSWKAGVPLLFLMSGVGVGAGVCVARSEMVN